LQGLGHVTPSLAGSPVLTPVLNREHAQIFAFMGLEEPSWYQQMKDNKMMVFVSIFMLNAVAGSLAATGAFEIYLDGESADDDGCYR
jgi:hypothetical protein